MRELPNCIYCASENLEVADQFNTLLRVTSDCKPWSSGGKIAICSDCGFAQTVVDEIWHDEVRAIYLNYEIFHQSSGGSQLVMADTGGAAENRSDRLLRHFQTAFPNIAGKDILDFGCGNGDFLKSFNKAYPSWALHGVDLDDRCLEKLKLIPNFKNLFKNEIDSQAETFDLISVTHVLEHLQAPMVTLRNLRSQINPDGYLIIEVPNCEVDPISILTADHCSHFSSANLGVLLESAGFEVLVCATNWILKEIIAVAKPKSENIARLNGIRCDWLFGHAKWLINVRDHARDLAKNNEFGIFGTSIAGSWLFGKLHGDADFFVDEDPQRYGRELFGIPVIQPEQVPEACLVYLPFAPFIAQMVFDRLSMSISRLEMPEPLSG